MALVQSSGVTKSSTDALEDVDRGYASTGMHALFVDGCAV